MGVTYGINPTWAAQTDAGRTHIATKGVVQDGLVLNLDAGASTSYPGSGTTWTDLSGNGNNGTLTNGPTYSSSNGGSIVFDGTDDYVQVSGSITTTSATFVAWVRLDDADQVSYTGVIFSRGTSVTGMSFRSTTEEISYTWNDSASTYNWASGLVVPSQEWCMISVSVNSSSATAYLCRSSGISSATNILSHASTTLDDIEIGRDSYFIGRPFGGNISVAQIYNKALTASEIQQNFNVLRGRFGI